ncbi:MAG: YciI family protein [Saprospiraceae bacterium]|nr:YciI family protein [Saprospiraceae bacterium]
MIQFVIEALDHTDAEGLNRRMAVREKHLEGASVLKHNGNYVVAGAKLDSDGKMIGSTMVVQFPTEADFKAYFDNEPYVKGNVWGKINVYKFRVANI